MIDDGCLEYDGGYTAITMAVLRNLMPLATIFLAVTVVLLVGGWLIAVVALLGLAFGVGSRLFGLGGESILNRQRSTPP